MELARSTSPGGFSVRGIFTFVATVLITAFLWAIIGSPLAHAATDASWNGDKLIHQTNSYTKQTADGTTPPNLTKGTVYYAYFSPNRVMDIIYFPSGTPDTATSGTYISYNIDSGGVRGPPINGPTTISITPRSASSSSTQVTWSGSNLLYDGRTYEGNGSKPQIATGTKPPGIAKDSQYYLSFGTDGLARILYFAPGVNVTTAKTATYQAYDINGSGFEAKNGASKTVNLTPLAESPDESGSTTDDKSSCNIDGVGWIVCPISNFLAWGMDRIFDLLKGFLEVQPLSTDTQSGLYQAWNIGRNLANVAFVIVFLIVIYSQITSIGITNYGLKKLIPRMIVAAILVNLSYYICAVFVDISNIAGSNIQDIFVGIRQSIETPNSNDVTSWESVTSFVLATGTGTVAAGAAIGGLVLVTGGSIGAALILLLPMLLGLILAILVALLVLAARQALIIILIVTAPIAFVLYLLPNTEKLFERWRSIFVTMLVFFPLFAVIFGGSQLAAFLIIQGASGDNALNIILLAMFVQVAPLVLTPLLVRFSGSIITRVAGLVNNPKKGLIDRTRNWTKIRSEYLAARNMARRDPVRNRQVFRRFALTTDQMRRAREERLKTHQETSDARWTNSREYSNIQQQMKYSEQSKNEGSEAASLRYETSKGRAGHSRNLDMRSRDTQLLLENAKSNANLQWEQSSNARLSEARLRAKSIADQIAAINSTRDSEYEEFKHGRIGSFPATASVGTMLTQAKADTRLIAMNALRTESAKRAINEQFTKDIETNTEMINGQLLQTYAGGVQGVAGAQRALASAVNAQSNAYDEAIKNATAILSHGNYTDDTIVELALGNHAGTGLIMTTDIIEAATAKIASGQNASAILRVMKNLEINTSDANQDLRQTFVEQILKNPLRPKFLGANDLTLWRQGIALPPGTDRMHTLVVQAINANKFGADVLVTHDKDYLQLVYEAIASPSARMAMSPSALATLKDQIHTAKTNPLYSGKIADRKAAIDAIDSII